MENKPIIHIAARTFKPEEEEKFNEFYEKWYFEAYIPLLGNVTGLAAAERYRIVKENPNYPKYIQITHFNDLNSFQEYEKSAEMEAIRQAGVANFPTTDFRWYVQYELTRSWRK